MAAVSCSDFYQCSDFERKIVVCMADFALARNLLMEMRDDFHERRRKAKNAICADRSVMRRGNLL